jgi:hypothetical protein
MICETPFRGILKIDYSKVLVFDYFGEFRSFFWASANKIGIIYILVCLDEFIDFS